MAKKQADLDRREVLVLLEEALSTTTTPRLRQTVIGGLGALFESVQCAWTEVHTDLSEQKPARTTVAESSDEGTDLEQVVAGFSRYAWQHPVLALVVETGHSLAVSISELMSRETFTSLELYREFFTRVSVEDQLSVGYVEQGLATGLSVNRATWGFSDDEREVLTQVGRCVFPYYRLLQRLERSERNSDSSLPLIEVNTGAFTRYSDVLGLTPREAELLGEVARGHSNRQISKICGISEGTVRKHLENAFRRLGVNNRISAVTKSVEMIRRTIDGGSA